MAAEQDDVVGEVVSVLAGQLAGEDDGVGPERLTWEELRLFVAKRVRVTLAANPALMMSILYRVDVAEAEARRVLAYTAPAEIPFALADLLIERQVQKLQMRRRYSPNTESDENR